LRRAAKELDITPDQIRYWIKTAGLHTEKRENVVYISQDGFDSLQKITGLVRDGVSPAEAIRQVKVTAELVPVKKEDSFPPQRIEGIEKGLLLLAEENRALRQTVGNILEEVKAVRSENAALRGQMELLMPPKQNQDIFEILNRPVEQVKVWTPTPKPDPLENVGLLARAWTYLVHPEKLRRHVEN